MRSENFNFMPLENQGQIREFDNQFPVGTLLITYTLIMKQKHALTSKYKFIIFRLLSAYNDIHHRAIA